MKIGKNENGKNENEGEMKEKEEPHGKRVEIQPGSKKCDS
jgi:hypothetical protein